MRQVLFSLPVSDRAALLSCPSGRGAGSSRNVRKGSRVTANRETTFPWDRLHWIARIFLRLRRAFIVKVFPMFVKCPNSRTVRPLLKIGKQNFYDVPVRRASRHGDVFNGSTLHGSKLPRKGTKTIASDAFLSRKRNKIAYSTLDACFPENHADRGGGLFNRKIPQDFGQNRCVYSGLTGRSCRRLPAGTYPSGREMRLSGGQLQPPVQMRRSDRIFSPRAGRFPHRRMSARRAGLGAGAKILSL